MPLEVDFMSSIAELSAVEPSLFMETFWLKPAADSVMAIKAAINFS